MQPPFTFRAAARLVDFMRQADEPGVITLAAGVPGLDALPFTALQEAYEEAFRTDGAKMFAYHHPEGDRALRSLLAERLQARGVEGVSGSEVITASGCTQALQVMLSILVQPGDIVACEAPAYYGLLELISEAGARVLPLPIDGIEGVDPEQARELFLRWKPKCVVVCTTLSNPSGATLSQARRKRLVEVCRETGVRLVEDDIYSELADAGAPVPCRAYDDGSTVSFVTSFSKSVSPGLRVGYCLAGTPELHDAFAARKTQQDIHSSVVSEVGLRTFIQRGSLDPHLDWLRKRNQGRRALALATIEAHFPKGTKTLVPCGGYMLWVELPEAFPASCLAGLKVAARKEGVVFGSGEVFFAATPEKAYLRLGCAKASESELERGIATIGRLVQSL